MIAYITIIFGGERLSKKDLHITLNNIDIQLEKAIDKVIEDLSLKTMNLNLKHAKNQIQCKAPLIKVKISDDGEIACSITREFFDEYREFNRNLQNLVFKYMKVTNSYIEFEYGEYK